MRLLHQPHPPFYLGLAAACDTCGQVVDFDRPDDVRVGSAGSADAAAVYVWTCPACYCVTLRTQVQMEVEGGLLRAALVAAAPGG
jgi:hypothetical protein